MRNSMMKTIGGGAAAAVLAGVMALGATSASAGVTGCTAPGGTQKVGAVVGAVVGGLIGNKVGGRQPALETVGGAAVGAAAGSVVGCEMQKSRTSTQVSQGSSSYVRDGYRLSSDVAPARYSRIDGAYFAKNTVNLRAAPTTNSAKVGRLRSGERFQALAQARGTDWILVGQGGVGVGYVRGDHVRPEGRRYAGY